MKYVLPLFLCFFLGACVSNTPMKSDLGAGLQGKTLSVDTSEKTHFTVITGGQALVFGIFAPMTGLGEGDRLIQEGHLPDAAADLGPKLGQRLANRYNMKTVSGQDGDLTLVVRGNMFVKHYALDMNNYIVMVNLFGTLQDSKTKKVISEGRCNYEPKFEDTDDAPSWDDLFAHDAEGMKSHIAKAEAYCLEEFMSRIFTK